VSAAPAAEGNRPALAAGPAMEINEMTLVFASYSTVQSNTVLVPAQAGKIIRVVKLAVTTWATMKVILLSDPGPDPLSLTPPLHVGSGVPLLMHLGRSLALATGREKALGMTAVFQSVPAEFSIAVWYELVS
jgi:hypothetical protein